MSTVNIKMNFFLSELEGQGWKVTKYITEGLLLSAIRSTTIVFQFFCNFIRSLRHITETNNAVFTPEHTF